MRLFVAVNLPAPTRAALWHAVEPLRRAGYPFRWVREDAIHLTLKFLGEVSSDREGDVIEAIDRATEGIASFTLALGGFGAFPNPRRARILWVGCEPVPSLELVYHRVEEGMHVAGFPLEGRPFRPHLTLGRLQRDARPAKLHGLDGALERLSYASELTVQSVDLMESELTRAGARYTRRHVGELAS
jgi:2'-5' RNA ligase